jgi:hypothetical protein
MKINSDICISLELLYELCIIFELLYRLSFYRVSHLVQYIYDCTSVYVYRVLLVNTQYNIFKIIPSVDTQ